MTDDGVTVVLIPSSDDVEIASTEDLGVVEIKPREKGLSVEKLGADEWLWVISFLDARSAVRLWMAASLKKKVGISESSDCWIGVLKSLAGDRDMDDIKFRLTAHVVGGSSSDNRTLKGINLVRSMYENRKCGRSGCLQIFQENSNFGDSCHYHSGKMRLKKLTCCGQPKFNLPGCKRGFHDAQFFNIISSARPNEKEKEKEKEKQENNEQDNDGGASLPSPSLPPINKIAVSSPSAPFPTPGRLFATTS